MNKFLEEVWAIALYDFKKIKLWKYILTVLAYVLSIILIGTIISTFLDIDYNYTAFFSSGFIVFMVIFSALQAGIEIIRDEKGLIRILLVAPISKYSLLLGKVVVHLFSITRNLFVVTLILLFTFGDFGFVKSVLLFLLTVLLLVTFYGIGLYLASVIKNPATIKSITGYALIFTLLTSGIFFPSSKNAYLSIIAKINPISYAVDLFRFIMNGQGELSLIADICIVALLLLIGLLLGSYAFNKKIREK